jgi:hypothetical protein
MLGMGIDFRNHDGCDGYSTNAQRDDQDSAGAGTAC